MLTTNGRNLSAEVAQEALRMFTYRSTADNPRSDKRYAIQFESDHAWLWNTEFFVTQSGALDKRAHHCISSPTWPNNPEYRMDRARAWWANVMQQTLSRS